MTTTETAAQPLKYAAPTHPMPGDAVRLDGIYRGGVKTGAVAIVDGAHYDPKDRELLIVFGASAFRGPRSSRSSIGAVLEEILSGNVIGRDVVSCSGGPCPFVKFDDLTFVGTRVQTFWKWRDGIPGGGRGEHYSLEVPLWSWAGPKEPD